jgi:DNA-binding transcriptional ArsR family regulator
MSGLNLSEILKSFSDQTRLRIMLILQENELAVNEIVDILEMNQSAVSNQLSSLKKASILKNRKEGKRIYYSLDDDIREELQQDFLRKSFPEEEKRNFFKKICFP